MKKILIVLLLLGSIGCAPKTHTFRGKMVTEKQFNRKLNRYTLRFLKKNPEFIELWNDVEVVYDTIHIENPK